MTIYYITESVDDVETVPFDREEDPSWDWCDLEPAE